MASVITRKIGRLFQNIASNKNDHFLMKIWCLAWGFPLIPYLPVAFETSIHQVFSQICQYIIILVDGFFSELISLNASRLIEDLMDCIMCHSVSVFGYASMKTFLSTVQKSLDSFEFLLFLLILMVVQDCKVLFPKMLWFYINNLYMRSFTFLHESHWF